MKKLTIIWIITFLLPGCDYEFPEVSTLPGNGPGGTVDFSNFVLLGSSWASGFMDGALYTEGQNTSFPALISQAVNSTLEAPNDFVQPDIDSENGYNLFSEEGTTPGRFQIEFQVAGSDRNILPKALNGEPIGTFDGGPLNNFSVPNLKLIDADLSTASDNPLYTRFAADPGQSTVLQEVIDSNPSLIILHLGMEDILFYAMNGLTGDANPDPAQIGEFDLTPMAFFEQKLVELIQRLVNETGADIVTATIPDVAQFPYFNFWGHTSDISPTEAGVLSQGWSAYNFQAAQFNTIEGTKRPLIRFFPDSPPWGIVYWDPSLPDVFLPDGSEFPFKYHQMVQDDHLLWSAPELPRKNISFGYGLLIPYDKKFMIKRNERLEIRELINQYNEIINKVANASNRVSVLDLHTVFSDIFNVFVNVTFDGVPLTSDFSRTTIFSADGVNLNQRGSAFVANKFIEHINARFGSSIPLVNVNQFKGNQYVNGF